MSANTPVKNKYCRKIRIKNFRNIVDQDNEMTINKSLDVDKLGCINFIVGPNNCGKSNLLDAIERLNTQEFDPDRDSPMFEAEQIDDPPEISIVIYDGEEKKYQAKSTTSKDDVEIIWNGVNKDEFLPLLSSAMKKIGSHEELHESKQAQALSTLQNIKRIDAGKIKAAVDIIKEEEVNKYISKNMPSQQDWASLKRKIDQISFKIHTTNSGSDIESYDDFEKEYGYPYLPRVIRYEQKNIKSSDLSCGYEFNTFISRLLDLTGLKKKVESAHNLCKKKSGQIAYCKEVEEKLNVKSADFSTKFNDLYMYKDTQYSFTFGLSEDKIEFIIWKGNSKSKGNVQDIDWQSVGFRWFFDFFFNLLCDNSLKPGDIIIMDEPATNIHVSGQVELVKFIRDFAIEHGVTFIISTHSPFFINCDYLDEVRLLTLDDRNRVHIHDKFTVIDSDNPDQMDRILRGLTVGRHIIVNPNEKTVFVEGITDYNYLTAFKHLFGYDGVTFLPINGLGESNNDFRKKDIIDKLKTIERYPILLVDGDSAGTDMKEYAESVGGIEIIQLSEIDNKFRDIEHVFSEEDRELYDLANKDWHKSSVFKQMASSPEKSKEMILSEETRDNFDKVLTWILDGGETDTLE